MRRWYTMLLALFPGTTRRAKARNAELLRSRRNPAFCFEGPWQSKQFSRRIGCTSLAKSTFAWARADRLPPNPSIVSRSASNPGRWNRALWRIENPTRHGPVQGSAFIDALLGD